MKGYAVLSVVTVLSAVFTGFSASAEPVPFANYSGDFRMDPTGAVWGSYYHEGPWVWFPNDNDPAPFWTPQTSLLWEAQYLPPEMRPDGTLAIPYAATITIKATDNGRIDGDPVGTMVFQSPGVIIGDLSPAAITVDSLHNLFFLPYWAESPAPMTLVEETGVFETDGIEVARDLLYETRGVIGLATVEGMTPAEVMMTFGFSPDRVVGAMGEGVVYGTYAVPEPSTLVLLGMLAMFPFFRSCPIRPVCRALVLTAVFLGVGTLEAETIVVPPAFENDEGNRAFLTIPQPTGFRVQVVYPASDFAQAVPGPGRFVRMALRPDHSVNASRTAVWHDFELRLSTTNRGPGSLSSVFNHNFGDDMTVVASGDLTTFTQGAGPPDGPRPFDYVVDFEQPFVYDPSGGNLLVDVRCSSLEGLPYFDAEDYGDDVTRMLFAASGSASVATFPFDAVSVFAFSVGPEPLPGDLSGDGLLDATDIDLLNAELRAEGNDVAFDLNDDAMVNGEDQRMWVKELKYTWFGDSNLDGEFTSSDMVKVFAAGKYETEEAAGWAGGDWNGDGVFDSSDMVTAFVDGGYEQGPRTDAVAVPEPGGWLFLSLGVVSLLAMRQRNRTELP